MEQIIADVSWVFAYSGVCAKIVECRWALSKSVERRRCVIGARRWGISERRLDGGDRRWEKILEKFCSSYDLVFWAYGVSSLNNGCICAVELFCCLIVP